VTTAPTFTATKPALHTNKNGHASGRFLWRNCLIFFEADRWSWIEQHRPSQARRDAISMMPVYEGYREGQHAGAQIETLNSTPCPPAASRTTSFAYGLNVKTLPRSRT